MITQEQEASIHAAMEASGGSIAAAAKLLALERSALSNAIHNNQALRERWAKPKSRTTVAPEALVLHRPDAMQPSVQGQPEGGPVLRSDLEIAQAMEAEDAAVRNRLEAIGLDPKVAKMAQALQTLNRRHFRSCNEMVGGGVIKVFLLSLSEVEELTRRLNDTVNPPCFEQEKAWRQDRAQLIDGLQKLADRVNQGTLVQAKVKALLSQTQNKGHRPGKPGFSPMVAVKVEGNATFSQPQ